jgi:magnesium-transporting ATPase (P-type)
VLGADGAVGLAASVPWQEDFPATWDNMQYKEHEEKIPHEGYCFVGLISLIDPPKVGVPEAVSACRVTSRVGRQGFRALFRGADSHSRAFLFGGGLKAVVVLQVERCKHAGIRVIMITGKSLFSAVGRRLERCCD